MPEKVSIWSKAPRQHHDAVKRGSFGAHTFSVEGGIYFGKDRLDAVEEALGAAAGRPLAKPPLALAAR